MPHLSQRLVGGADELVQSGPERGLPGGRGPGRGERGPAGRGEGGPTGAKGALRGAWCARVCVCEVTLITLIASLLPLHSYIQLWFLKKKTFQDSIAVRTHVHTYIHTGLMRYNI